MTTSTDNGGYEMAKKTRRYTNVPPPSGFVQGAPREAVAAEFGRLLQKKMVEKNWSQSDLARAAAKYTPDKKFPRDTISGYVRGENLPGPVRLGALAKAFGVKSEDLLPTRGSTAVDERAPPLSVRSLGDGNMWLQVNQAVPQSVALKILALLEQSDASKT